MINEFRSKKLRRFVIVGSVGFIAFSICLLVISNKLTATMVKETEALLSPGDLETEEDFRGSVYFNAEEDSVPIMPLMVAAVEAAKNNVTMVMYSFDSPALADAFSAAHKRGVKVTVILDLSNHARHTWFLKKYPEIPVVELGFEDERYFMHHKYLLIDEGTSDARLFYGGLNFTKLQEKIDPSFVLETRDQAFIAPFIEETDRLRSGLHGRAKFRTDFKPWAAKLQYPNGWMEVWFSPGYRENSPKTRYLELFAEAKESIDVAIWVLTDKETVQALIAKAEDGVAIRVIADNAFFWGPESSLPLLERAERGGEESIEVFSDVFRTIQDMRRKNYVSKHTSYLHQHFAIIDNDILITGTNNWSDNGFYDNDESIVITNIPEVVAPFTGWMKRAYAKLRGEKLLFSQKAGKISLDADQAREADHLIIYTEPLTFGKDPELCFEAQGKELRGGIVIPKSCLGSRNHAFLLDEVEQVIAGSYL